MHRRAPGHRLQGRFGAIHRHGFVRVAAATPIASAGDVAFNLEQTLLLAREAQAKGVDLVVYPELNLSSYAVDDLHLQDAFLGEVERSIARLVEESAKLAPVLVAGAPIEREGRVYNAGLAIARGRLLGVVPKTFLPNYREYYEKRWFASGLGLDGLEIAIGGHKAPFGPDLVFAAEDLRDFIFHIEICEDYWAPQPPSTLGAMAGAIILTNLSASNITIGKADERQLLCASQSNRCIAAYVFSAAGPGESTTDLAWDGQGSIYELGELLAESSRFCCDPELAIADVDVQRLRLERMRNATFGDNARAAGYPEKSFRRIGFAHQPGQADIGFERKLRRFPYVPNRPDRLDHDCYEAFNIQVQGLATRMQATRGKRLVIGVSGGLDSTHALIVAAKTCDWLKLPRSSILGFTMPGFATSDATRKNAWALMNVLGVAAEEIDIRPAAQRMLEDIGHPFARGEAVYDVTFENVQAGLRTDYLFRLANQRGGLVVGTGDLSEIALGWSTYGVGDQMSHYGVNAGVPKTLIQYLIRWAIRTGQFDAEANRVLQAILDTKITPELVPDGDKKAAAGTEERIGPYELHDFFLFHILRSGQPPSKVAFLAWQAWRNAKAGPWPIDYPEALKREYDLPTIRKWLEVFLTRFFGLSQFKRSAIPNSPKVSGGGALSPRGDWRAPSDGTAEPWLAELKRAFDA
ncbi:MAG: NAD(+) synthase [Sphingosinicella sp.]